MPSAKAASTNAGDLYTFPLVLDEGRHFFGFTPWLYQEDYWGFFCSIYAPFQGRMKEFLEVSFFFFFKVLCYPRYGMQLGDATLLSCAAVNAEAVGLLFALLNAERGPWWGSYFLANPCCTQRFHFFLP